MDNYLVTRLPNSSHRSVCLSGYRPPVRIDMHRELVQMLKDPERFLVCKGIFLDDSIQLQTWVRKAAGKRS